MTDHAPESVIPFKVEFNDPFLDRPSPATAMTRTSQGFPALLPGVERAIATSYDAANSLEMRSYLRNFRDPETMLKVAANAVMDGDMVEAAKWWLCAAGDKNAYAIHQLGLCCLHGLGLPFNPFEAAEWFTKGAELEHPPSLDLLGMCYKTGTGVDRDREYSVDLLKRSSATMYAPGELNLGIAYFEGSGIARNDTLALRFISKSALKGHQPAEVALAEMERFVLALENRFAELPPVTRNYFRLTDPSFLHRMRRFAHSAGRPNFSRLTMSPESDSDPVLSSTIWMDINNFEEDRPIPVSPIILSFDDLEPHIWGHIIQFLPLRFQLNTFQSINRAFRTGLKRLVLPIQSSLTIASLSKPSQISNALNMYSARIRQLILRDCTCVNDSHLISAAKQFPILSKFQLDNCINITDSGLSFFLAKYAFSLNSLTLAHLNGSALSSSLLNVLSDFWNPNNDIEYLMHQFQIQFDASVVSMRNEVSSEIFQELNLIDMPRAVVSEDALLSLFAYLPSSFGCPNIRILRLERGAANGPAGADFVTDSILQELHSAENLICLSLAGMNQFSSDLLLRLLNALPNLIELDVSRCAQIDDVFVGKMTKTPFSSRVRRLGVSNCINLTDSGRCQIFASCPQVEGISIHAEFTMDPEGIAKLETKMKEFVPLVSARIFFKSPERHAPLFSSNAPPRVEDKKKKKKKNRFDQSGALISPSLISPSPSYSPTKTPSRLIIPTKALNYVKPPSPPYVSIELIWGELPPPPPSQRITLYYEFLHPGLWAHIFEFLPTSQVFLDLATLKREFYFGIFQDVLPLRLRFDINRAPRDADVDSNRVLKTLWNATSTVKLSLQRMSSWSDDVFEVMLVKMRDLEYLDLSFCSQITDRTIYAICGALCAPHLKTLILTNCPHISNAALLEILTKCIKLETFRFSLEFDLTREGVNTLRHDLSEYLALTDGNIFIQAAEHNGKTPLPHLRFVENCETTEEKTAKARALGFLELIEEEEPPPPPPPPPRIPTPPPPQEPWWLTKARAMMPPWYTPLPRPGNAIMYIGRTEDREFNNIFDFLPVSQLLLQIRRLSKGFRKYVDKLVDHRNSIQFDQFFSRSRIDKCLSWAMVQCDGGKSIRRIDGVDCFELNDTHMDFLSTYLPNISFINIENCNSISDAGLVPLLSWSALNLRSLTFKNIKSPLTEVCWQALCHAWDPEMVVVPRTKHKIKLQSSTSPSPSATRFQELYLVDVPQYFVPEAAMIRMFSLLPRTFYNGISMTPRGNPNLIALAMERSDPGTINAGSDFVSDGILEGLALAEPWCLEVFSLSGMRLWGDRALGKLLKECKFLRSIDLSRCLHITDNTIDVVTKTVGPTLQYLNLAECFRLTDASIQKIQACCPKLRWINLTAVYSISATTMKKFRANLKNVKILFHLPL